MKSFRKNSPEENTEGDRSKTRTTCFIFKPSLQERKGCTIKAQTNRWDREVLEIKSSERRRTWGFIGLKQELDRERLAGSNPTKSQRLLEGGITDSTSPRTAAAREKQNTEPKSSDPPLQRVSLRTSKQNSCKPGHATKPWIYREGGGAEPLSLPSPTGRAGGGGRKRRRRGVREAGRAQERWRG